MEGPVLHRKLRKTPSVTVFDYTPLVFPSICSPSTKTVDPTASPSRFSASLTRTKPPKSLKPSKSPGGLPRGIDCSRIATHVRPPQESCQKNDTPCFMHHVFFPSCYAFLKDNLRFKHYFLHLFLFFFFVRNIIITDFKLDLDFEQFFLTITQDANIYYIFKIQDIFEIMIQMIISIDFMYKNKQKKKKNNIFPFIIFQFF